MVNSRSDSQVSAFHAYRNDSLGALVLGRPNVGNALGSKALDALSACLHAWRDDAGIQAVVLMSDSGDFCVGHEFSPSGAACSEASEALHAQLGSFYRLLETLHHFPKPTIALAEGLSMGDGVSLGQVAKLRVINERTRLCMLEADRRLGLSALYFAAQCPGRAGNWLALSGDVIEAGEMMALGLADVFVPSVSWRAMHEALLHGSQPNAEHVIATIMECAELTLSPRHLPDRVLMDKIYGAADLDALLSAAAAAADGWTCLQRERLSAQGPALLARRWEVLEAARRLPFGDLLSHILAQAKPSVTRMKADGNIDTSSAPATAPPRLP